MKSKTPGITCFKKVGDKFDQSDKQKVNIMVKKMQRHLLFSSLISKLTLGVVVGQECGEYLNRTGKESETFVKPA